MNILQRTIIEVKIGERFYVFECLPDSPLSEISQALSSMSSYISSRISEVEKNKEEEPKAKEE